MSSPTIYMTPFLSCPSSPVPNPGWAWYVGKVQNADDSDGEIEVDFMQSMKRMSRKQKGVAQPNPLSILLYLVYFSHT
jgi:hypothetical protein